MRLKTLVLAAVIAPLVSFQAAAQTLAVTANAAAKERFVPSLRAELAKR